MEILPLLLIFAVMMLPLLFISNRQKKAQQKQMALVRELGVGDEVRTHSGFYGLIVESYDEFVILESEDGSQSKWARQAVAMKVEDQDLEQTADETEAGDGAEGAEGPVPGVTVADETPASDFSSDFSTEDPRSDKR